jgi:uncharacterized protein
MNVKLYPDFICILLLLLLSGCSGGKSPKNGEAKTVPGNVTNSLKGAEIDMWGAALEGDLGKVKSALESGRKVNAPDKDGRTALMYAAYDGHTEIINLLLSSGASVNLQDNSGRTALMMASSGPFPSAVSILIDNFADPNLTDRVDHFTALMYAAAEGQLEVVKILVPRGADPSLKDKDGDTAASFAAKNGHQQIVEYLNSYKK